MNKGCILVLLLIISACYPAFGCNECPIAIVASDSSDVCLEEEVGFADNGSYDPDDDPPECYTNIIEFDWDLPQEAEVVEWGENNIYVICTFDTPGTYTIKMRVLDNEYTYSDWDSVTIKVRHSPSLFSVPVYYRVTEGEQIYEGSYSQDVGYSYYHPDYTCWCAHLTSLYNEYEHADIASVYQLSHDYDSDGEDETIELSDIDAYWANHYYTSANGYSLVQGADYTYNCHGYSTGKNIWIQSMAKLKSDDYETTTIDEASIFMPSGGHSIRIMEHYPNGNIKITQEKNNSSGIYRKTYAEPGYSPSGTFLKPK